MWLVGLKDIQIVKNCSASSQMFLGELVVDPAYHVVSMEQKQVMPKIVASRYPVVAAGH